MNRELHGAAHHLVGHGTHVDLDLALDLDEIALKFVDQHCSGQLDRERLGFLRTGEAATRAAERTDPARKRLHADERDELRLIAAFVVGLLVGVELQHLAAVNHEDGALARSIEGLHADRVSRKRRESRFRRGGRGVGLRVNKPHGVTGLAVRAHRHHHLRGRVVVAHLHQTSELDHLGGLQRGDGLVVDRLRLLVDLVLRLCRCVLLDRDRLSYHDFAARGNGRPLTHKDLRADRRCGKCVGRESAERDGGEILNLDHGVHPMRALDRSVSDRCDFSKERGIGSYPQRRAVRRPPRRRRSYSHRSPHIPPTRWCAATGRGC